jgi:hypothetical protein
MWIVIGLISSKNQRRAPFIIANICIILSLIPQYLVFNEDKQEALTRWRVYSKLEDWLTIFHEFFRSDFLLYCSFLLISVSIYHLVKSKNKAVFTIITSFFTSLILAYFISKWIPFFYAKYLLYLFPFLTLIIGFGLSKFTQNKISCLISSVVLTIPLIISMNLNYQKAENWKLVADTSKKYVSEDTDIIISPVYMYRPYTYYFDQKKFKNPKELKPNMYNDYHTYFISKMSSVSFEYRKPEKIIFIVTHQSVTPEGSTNLFEIQKLYKLINTEIIGSIKIHQLVLRHA